MVTAARTVPKLSLRLHCGGLFIGRAARRLGDDLRDFVLSQDARITAMTGQWFGPGYRSSLMNGAEIRLDSAPPSRAILAAERLAGLGAEMLHAIHQAYYVDGRPITEGEILLGLAEEIGLTVASFTETWQSIDDQELAREIAKSRALMSKHGVSGLPTFVLERDDSLTLLDHQRYYGKPQAWRAMLSEGLQRILH